MEILIKARLVCFASASGFYFKRIYIFCIVLSGPIVPLVLRISLASVADAATGFMSPIQVCLLPFLNSTLPVMCSNHENITLG